MNRLKLGLSVAGLACAGVALVATAQPAPPPAMAGEGRVVTRDEAKAGAEMLFSRLDVNHDGRIDAADRAAELSRVFDRIDTNHDGSISRDEFLAAHPHGGDGPPMGAPGMAGPGMGAPGMMGHGWAGPGAGGPGAGGPGAGGPGAGGPGAGGPGAGAPGMHERAMGLGMEIIRLADPQHTGTVSHDGFIAAALALFDRADADHDGKVTPAERRAAHPMMGHRDGRGPGGPMGAGPMGAGPMGGGPMGSGPMGDGDMPGVPN